MAIVIGILAFLGLIFIILAGYIGLMLYMLTRGPIEDLSTDDVHVGTLPVTNSIEAPNGSSSRV